MYDLNGHNFWWFYSLNGSQFVSAQNMFDKMSSSKGMHLKEFLSFFDYGGEQCQ